MTKLPDNMPKLDEILIKTDTVPWRKKSFKPPRKRPSLTLDSFQSLRVKSQPFTLRFPSCHPRRNWTSATRPICRDSYGPERMG